ncbi:probable LRR receptor-like serine/threonine-protein kinase At3g47570 isoform X2 [Coffea eugenioides]|uniref:probable LRR receptor-like serine/threonine-protein kinase At3g47570 isoform X2 n=1 Tax=Coffea eugenioides TaxID=49369 RepID=UPI000F604634|nr:probable LRR receptor-like serine/threonine-protein kinase At3g47570 isoform X2 [Coffea eugenioides]
MKKLSHLYFPPGLFLLGSLLSCLAMAAPNITSDQSALLSLKAKITGDPHEFLASNWSATSSVCDWRGVTCGSRHRRVTALNISNLGLTGTIPPQLGNLSFLMSLDMSRNNFYGELPHELIRLSRLRVLSLGINMLSGNIPSWVGSFQQLRHFSLKNNSFTGFIPPSISNMSKLETLILQVNSLQGAIPMEIGKLKKLKRIALDYNQLAGSLPLGMFNISSLEAIALQNNSLSGSLPSSICPRLQGLTWLDLGLNKLSGAIPPSLSECSKLQVLRLDGNHLSGVIPEGFGNLTALVDLRLARNNLIGVIPEGFGNLTALVELFLSSNNLSGVIPEGFGNLTALKQLYLSWNNLIGRIPQELGNLRHLEELVLGFNSLTGSIPAQIFNISTLQVLFLPNNTLSGRLPSSMGHGLINLEWLDLPWNEFEGVIPASISNTSKLTILELSGNRFSGPVPKSLGNLRLLRDLLLDDNHLTTEPSSRELSFISYLTNCKYLEILAFGGNPLHGFLPISVGNLSTSMERFYADGCGIKGSIPDAIGNLSSLMILNLDGNHLSGPVPSIMKSLQNLQVLDLGANQLSGSIPDCICSLKRLYQIELWQNQFRGSMPSCLNNISSLREIDFAGNLLDSSIPGSLWNLTDLLKLNLSYNSLSGSLPYETGNLKVVTLLDLSGNQLNGNIPSSLGDLQSLATLSLAQNKLQGPIPDSLSHVLSLQFLDLSNNNLSGPIPKSLETLLDLKHINLSFNRLRGEIPSSGPFENFTYESFMSNDDLCGAQRFHVPPCPSPRIHKSSQKKVFHMLGILSGIAATIIALTTAAILLLRCRRKDGISRNTNLLPVGLPKMISYYELVQATNGYDESNLLGKGSFGSVYKGTLTDGTVVAVKVFTLLAEVTSGSFDTECEVLRNLRHRNLTKVIGSCSNLDFKALVLDYKSNGSLEKWLYSHNHCLDLLQRISIMMDVASALEYLHFGYTTPVVHCDLKPSNILLDESMVAHVSDFGMAKFLDEESSVLHTKTLATLGYLAPEYGLEGQVSTRVDVFSFGIVLMETFSRMKPSDEMFKDDLSLKKWIEESLPNATVQVIDGNLLRQQDKHFNQKLECISMIFKLALSCCVECPRDRTNMKDVVAALQKIKRQLESFPNISA